MLTLSNLRDVVTHVIGGGDPTTQLPPDPPTLATTTADSVRDHMINTGGKYMTSMHDWYFRQRPKITTDFKSGQDYALLPGDCGQLDGVRMTNSVISQITIVTPQFLESLRSGLTSTGTTDHWVALAFRSQPGKHSSAPVPHLELWPTPTADESGALTIIYKAKWLTLSSSNHVANIPEYMDFLLEEVVRAVALGWEEFDNASVGARLKVLRSEPIFGDAKADDSLQINTGGQMSGGQMQPPLESHSYSWRWLTNSPVSDPT